MGRKDESHDREARRRRALNIVWTAAGSYGFLPDFLAFHRDGSPDIYLNMIIGLAHRFYEPEKLADYVRSLEQSYFCELFTDVLWLGIEQAVYKQELPARPVLAELREKHARQFLQDEIDVSMQQLMMRNEIVHTLKAGRCREILGKPSGIRNPWDKNLYLTLDYPAGLTTDELIARTEQVLRRFFVFRFETGRRGSWHIPLSARLYSLLRRFLPMEQQRGMEPVRKRNGSAAAGEAAENSRMLRGWTNKEKKLADIQQLFGPPLFPEEKRQMLERELCCGNHCRAQVYFANGHGGRAVAENWAFWQAHLAEYKLAMHRIQERLKSSLLVYRQPLPVVSRQGIFCPSLVWRALKMQDARVFTERQEEEHALFDVTLLLDASESRKGQQGLVASQAYAIAGSLTAAGIPVQVISFCSTDGFTVLCRLKSFGTQDCDGIFGYFAYGWNRDGLALAGAEKLLDREAGRRQLLLVLTDANPSDMLDIPAAGGLMSRRYMEQAAVEDTAEAAKRLRQHGVRLSGLINSVLPESSYHGAVREIYGREAARVGKISKLADAAAGLIERQIRSSP